MAENYFLNLSGKEAFKAFVKSYDSHHLKEIFNIEKLDLTKVAKSFGFTVPPAVDLSILFQCKLFFLKFILKNSFFCKAKYFYRIFNFLLKNYKLIFSLNCCFSLTILKKNRHY